MTYQKTSSRIAFLQKDTSIANDFTPSVVATESLLHSNKTRKRRNKLLTVPLLYLRSLDYNFKILRDFRNEEFKMLFGKEKPYN